MLDEAVKVILCVFTLINILGSFLSSVVEDKSYKELIKSDKKMKYLWSKKGRAALLVTDYMETDEYNNLKTKLCSLYHDLYPVTQQ